MDYSRHHMGAGENHDHQNGYEHIEHMHSDHGTLNVSGDEDYSMNFGTDLRAGDTGGHGGHGGHHDPSHHHDGGGHDAHSMPHHDNMMMDMTFHGGSKETILFSWWQVTEIGEFTGSFIAIFFMALLYEGLKYYRKHLLWKTYSGLQYCAVAAPDKGISHAHADEPQVIQPHVPHVLQRSNIPTMMSTPHLWQTFLHGLQVLVSYMLMLVFMTYNVWLCAAVVFGSATGYFLFGWRESVVVDFTEHCH